MQYCGLHNRMSWGGTTTLVTINHSREIMHWELRNVPVSIVTRDDEFNWSDHYEDRK